MPAGRNPRSWPGPPMKNRSDTGTIELESHWSRPLNVNGCKIPQLNEECSDVPITVGESTSSLLFTYSPLYSLSRTPSIIAPSKLMGRCHAHPPFTLKKPTSPGGPATSPTRCASYPMVGSYRSSTKHPFKYSPAVMECLRYVPARRAISGEQSNAKGDAPDRFGRTSLKLALQSKNKYGPAMLSGGLMEGLFAPRALLMLKVPLAAPRAWLASRTPRERTNSLEERVCS
mmetsp:Transcript_40186/g.68544  ORF Transcript_40186/g.68544 Transcript_40186/m.68544 type:complete len:230 (+) Transcript_40186:426-1115(+)